MPMTARRILKLALALLGSPGCADQLDTEPFYIEWVDPPGGYRGFDVPLTIVGQGFLAKATDELGESRAAIDTEHHVWLGGVALRAPEYVDRRTLRAVAPAGIFAGSHDLRVENPYGDVASLPGAYLASDLRDAALEAVLSADVPTPTVGTETRLTLRVTNSGERTARAVTPTVLAFSPPNRVAVDTWSGPLQSDIAPGAAVELVWLCDALGVGPTQVVVSAAGTDELTGRAVATGSVGPLSLLVQAPVDLRAQLAVTPKRASLGQLVEIFLDVTAAPGVGADDVQPSLLVANGAADLQAGPLPASAAVAGGSTERFAWTYVTQSLGALAFAGSAAGADANSRLPVVTYTVESNPIVVESPARLSALFSVPGAVNTDQAFAVQVAVRNEGGATALAVTPPQFLTATGTAVATWLNGPAPATADIPGGTEVAFSWSYRAEVAGEVALAADVTGSDANSGQTVSTGVVSSTPIVALHPAALSCAITVPATVSRGATFTARMTVLNVGDSGANAVAPSALNVAGTAQLSVVSGPAPAESDLGGGGSVSFDWLLSAATTGSAELDVSAAGLDATAGTMVSCAPVLSNTVAVNEAEQLFSDPFGDASPFSFVVPYRGQILLGPRAAGAGAIRADADGANLEPLTFVFSKDTTGNTSSNTWVGAPPYPAIGYSGCLANSAQCGPDNENGRGLLAAGTIAGTEWLVMGGSRNAGNLDYVYATQDGDTQLDFSFVDLSAFLGANTRGISAMRVFNDRLYLAFPDTGGQRPYFLALATLPLPPGLDATASDVENLRADNMPGLGAGNSAPMVMIDWLWVFNDRLYATNNGGCIRSTTATPRAYAAFPSDWWGCTPNAPAYTAKTSVTTTKVANIEPADKAIPQMATFGGGLYLARNTTAGPQLWVCAPTLAGDPSQCDPPDWSLVAPNTAGDPQLSQFNSSNHTRLSLLVATPQHVYVGFDNSIDGVTLFRSLGAAPSTRSDFEGHDGCAATDYPTACEGLAGAGLGTAANTRILDGVATTFGGKDYVYVVTGNGTGAARVYFIRD